METLPQSVELKITFTPATGQVGVTGPLQQEVLCLGLLVKAQQIITALNARETQTLPVASAGGVALPTMPGGVMPGRRG